MQHTPRTAYELAIQTGGASDSLQKAYAAVNRRKKSNTKEKCCMVQGLGIGD